MYLRNVHAEHSLPKLREFIKDNPLGIITTAIPSDEYPLLQVSHIPWVLDVEDESSETETGVLRGHLTRANPQSRTMVKDIQSRGHSTNYFLEQEVLVLFNSPASHYVTPKFYVETKLDTGKVVPTWNYAAVQAYGKARIFFDTKSEETDNFLAKQIRDLSNLGESHLMKYQSPWGISDAPEKYISLLKKAIVGVQINIERLEGKFKMSQEMPEGDREGVVKGFRKLGSDTGLLVADLVEERGLMKDVKD